MHTPKTRFSNLHYFDPAWITETAERLRVDVCIYGGTSAGVVAAAKLARMGKTVALLQPGRHLGGLTSGGLGWTDYGKKHVIGGMARQFYCDVGREYGKDEEWYFEPGVAEKVMNRMASEKGITVRLCQYIDSVIMDGLRIAVVKMLGGLQVEAKQFIDASYEGDLLAKAGVSYAIGREGNATYKETLNGVQLLTLHWIHQFNDIVDPYIIPGDPASGLLPTILPDDMSSRIGEGDRRIQAYCFRVCMTDDPQLKLDWTKPENFDPRQYELATRWFNSGKNTHNDPLLDEQGRPCDVPAKFDIFPNKTPGGFHKTDTNNHGAVSSDYIGENPDWPEGGYETRERIFQRHAEYQKGYYWHVANSPGIPARYRKAWQRWGLPKDEFADTGHWPHQLYIREARRMVGDYVMTEHDCRQTRHAPDPVGMGSYNMDSHGCSRFAKMDQGRMRVYNEGELAVPPAGPYGISYRSIIPKRGECENLLVPVCVSTSHVAYGSVRMEPVFMVLGEAAAEAAALALSSDCPVQDVDYTTLRAHLLRDGQILKTTPAA
ncbi:MAG: FAD-dependent oxidoreductase [Opitutaceae bacterium]|jgi:hypothetical protein|nr:FAD-dependent oxidoreductase [Opitutaceae bacterium]